MYFVHQCGDLNCCPRPGGFMVTDIHEVSVGEVGVLQGARKRSGVAAVRGGLAAGILDIFRWRPSFLWRWVDCNCCLCSGGVIVRRSP